MMNANEIAEAWKEIVKIYNSHTESPVETMYFIIHAFGKEATKEIFATIAAIKKHDERIYGANKDYMNSIEINPENTEWNSKNPILYSELDDIHTTHINQLITELRKLDK